MNLGAALVLGVLALKFMEKQPTTTTTKPTTAPTWEDIQGRLKFGFGL